MIEQTKNMLIGLFVVIACGLIVGIILFIQPSTGDGKQLLYFRFSNVNGITIGTRVTFAGKPVGEVVDISTIPNARSQPTDILGQIYFYQITAHVDSHVKVYTTDDITTQTSGLLGEKSVAIVPRPLPQGITAKIATATTPLYANSVDPIESAFHQISQLSGKVEDAVDAIVTWVHDNGDALGLAIRSFDRAMTEIGDTMATVNQTGVVGDIQAAVQSFTGSSDTFHVILSQLQNEDVFTNIGITMDRVKNASGSIENILGDIEQGKGTLGKFISDDDFYLRLMSIMSKIDTTMNDVNHYGVLFNLNKEWQRTRQKRITVMNALKTPDEFKSYFESEVDLINTAMSRLSILIQKAQQSPDNERILQSNLFRKDFADLLKKVGDLMDNLKLYNEELMEAQPQGCP